MSRESIVEIPEGSGNRYRYAYFDGTTRYLGPVGSAPPLSEEEFLAMSSLPLEQHTDLAYALEREILTLEPVYVRFDEEIEVDSESEDDETIIEANYRISEIEGLIKITIEDYEGNRDLNIHIFELDTEAGEDLVYESIDRSFPLTTSTEEIVEQVMNVIREESSLQ